MFFITEASFIYIAWWSFLGSILVTIVVSLLTKPPSYEKLEGLVYGLVMKDQNMQDILKKRAEGEE
jgi:Na+/proline symporter